MPLLSTLARCAAAGVGTGIRTATPTALVAYAVSHGDLDTPTLRPFSLLQHVQSAAVAGLAAVGEDIADATIPSLPPRTKPVVLVGRMAIAAVLGVILCADDDQPIALGAGIGAIAAAWGSFAATGGRKALTEAGIPDIAASLLESAESALLGATAFKRVGSTVG